MEQWVGHEMLQKGKSEWTAAMAVPEGPMVDMVGSRYPGQPEGQLYFDEVDQAKDE